MRTLRFAYMDVGKEREQDAEALFYYTTSMWLCVALLTYMTHMDVGNADNEGSIICPYRRPFR